MWGQKSTQNIDVLVRVHVSCDGCMQATKKLRAPEALVLVYIRPTGEHPPCLTGDGIL